MTVTPAAMGFAVLARYQRGWLRGDVLAGVTVAAYLVPQVMAYAQVAGLDPVVGLWSAILPGLAYALLGTSRQISVGPDSTTAVMVAAAVAPVAAGDPARYAVLATATALLVGAICIAGGVVRLGFLGDLLSHPLLVGYLTGIALIMIVSQLDGLTGIPGADGGGVVEDIVEVLTNVGAVNLPTLALSVATIVFLFLAYRRAPWLPGPLVAVVGATVVTAVLNLDAHGVELVGQIPVGLPPFGLPAISAEDVASLALPALGIAIVAVTDAILTARSFAARNGYAIDPNRELVALGSSNLAAGLSSGMPVTDSASRTTIVDSVGGRSQLAGIIASGCVVLVLLFLGGLLARFPTAALAGLIVYAATRLIDLAGYRRLARFRPSELALAFAATAGVVLGGVLVGVAVAVALSVVNLFARVARPAAAILGRAPGVAGLHNIEDYPDAATIPGLLVFRYDAPLFFANANDFKTRVLAAVDDASEPVEWLLLNAEAIVDIDLTAADALAELHDELEGRGITFAMARVKQDLRDQLERIGLITHMGVDHLYPTLPVALEAFERRARREPATEPDRTSANGPG
jgi:high affinity sulfate transporter 1